MRNMSSGAEPLIQREGNLISRLLQDLYRATNTHSLSTLWNSRSTLVVLQHPILGDRYYRRSRNERKVVSA
jgi:hypothetical protein